MAWNNGISFRLPWYPSAKLFSDRLIPTTIHTSLLEGVCLTCFTLLYLSNSEVSAHQPVNPSNSRTRLLEDGVISIRLLRCYDLLYLAIWLYIHEIHIYIYTHTLWYDLSSPFLFLEHNHSTTSKKRSPCTFYDPILYHLVSTRPAGLWQGSWLWDLWSSCSCAIISV